MADGFLFDDMQPATARGAYGQRSTPVPEAGARPAPHSGSPTSRAAARRIAPVAGTIRGDVLAYLREQGAEGATADEIERALGRPGNTIRPRTVELRADGLIIQSDRVRPTASGRMAVVYVATPWDQEKSS